MKKKVNAWDTGNNKTYVTYSNDKGHASQMSLKTTQNNVAYEILKMKFIANILCWASLLWVFVVKKIFLFVVFFLRMIYNLCIFSYTKYALICYWNSIPLLQKSVCCTKVSKSLETLPFLRMFYRILYIK